MNNYKDLKILQKAKDLVELAYNLINELPESEKFGLISQIKRNSVSIPSKIAESAGRNSKKEFMHFLSIANGSTTELDTQLTLVYRLKLAEEGKINHLLAMCREIRNMNFSLQKNPKIET